MANSSEYILNTDIRLMGSLRELGKMFFPLHMTHFFLGFPFVLQCLPLFLLFSIISIIFHYSFFNFSLHLLLSSTFLYTHFFFPFFFFSTYLYTYFFLLFTLFFVFFSHFSLVFNFVIGLIHIPPPTDN